MLISGAHVILYSKDSEADRNFFREVLKFPYVDAGEGWLIFALPPAEVAVHPAKEDQAHALFLMCDDLDATLKSLKSARVKFKKIKEQRWGKIAMITLPSGAELGIYEPKHPVAHKAGRN